MLAANQQPNIGQNLPGKIRLMSMPAYSLCQTLCVLVDFNMVSIISTETVGQFCDCSGDACSAHCRRATPHTLQEITSQPPLLCQKRLCPAVQSASGARMVKKRKKETPRLHDSFPAWINGCRYWGMGNTALSTIMIPYHEE